MFLARYNQNLFQNHLDDMFNEFFNDTREYFTLQKDEDTKELYFEIELPGVKKENTKVSIDNKLLYIAGERKGKRPLKYERTISLPKNLEPESCRVTLEDGIMKILFKERGDPKINRKEILIE